MRDPYYKFEELLPILDQNGVFIDFALKSGHPIITDYSRIDREIIVKNNGIMFGDIKKKSKIIHIDELIKIVSKYILMVMVDPLVKTQNRCLLREVF